MQPDNIPIYLNKREVSVLVFKMLFGRLRLVVFKVKRFFGNKYVTTLKMVNGVFAYETNGEPQETLTITYTLSIIVV